MVRRILVCLFIGTQMYAMDADTSKAIANSLADQQRAKQVDSDVSKAIEASKAEHRKEAQARIKRQEEADTRRAIQASLAHPQPTKSRKWLKWMALAGVSIAGAVAYWYFRDTVNSKALSSYNHLRSLVSK